jgi:uncharacterized membrane protein
MKSQAAFFAKREPLGLLKNMLREVTSVKHLLRFSVVGIVYFFVEVVWRIWMGHGEASFLMAPMAGVVALVVFALEDRRLNVILTSCIGAVTITTLELIVGSIALFGFGVRFWHYGRINLNGFIALDWSFIWWGLCFALILARRILTHYLADRKKKREE